VVAAVAAVAAVVAAVAAVAVANSLGTAADLNEKESRKVVQKEHILRRLSHAALWSPTSLLVLPLEMLKSSGKVSAFYFRDDNASLHLCYKLKKS
jgi:type II secretory pathway pseudopilin PulG